MDKSLFQQDSPEKLSHSLSIKVLMAGRKKRPERANKRILNGSWGLGRAGAGRGMIGRKQRSSSNDSKKKLAGGVGGWECGEGVRGGEGVRRKIRGGGGKRGWVERPT